MARSRYDWTKDKFERYIKEGRGEARGKKYKPWLTIQDFFKSIATIPASAKIEQKT